MSFDAVHAESTSAGGFGWIDLRALSVGWFDGLAAILVLVKEGIQKLTCSLAGGLSCHDLQGRWRRHSHWAKNSECLTYFYRLWATVRLSHIQDWSGSWLPNLCLVLGKDVVL